MNQAALNFTVPLARATDPATSHQAAAKARLFKGGQAANILAALVRHGPQGPKQLFDFTGLSVVQIDRRRKEMVQAGLIRVLDREIDGCSVWEAV